MQGQILHVRDMGHDGFWRMMHEARPDTESGLQGETLRGCHVLLIMAQPAMAQQPTLAGQAEQMEGEHLVRAAVTRAGGTLQCVRLDPALTASTALLLQAPLYAACADLAVTVGLSSRSLDVLAASCDIPLCNGGNALNHPCAALADLALISAQEKPLDTVRLAWIGSVNGLGHALMEAAIYAPFELFMAVPPWGEPDRDLTALALKAGAKIFLTHETHMAMDGAHYVYAGPATAPESSSPQAGIALTASMLTHAREGARVMAGSALLGLGQSIEDEMLNQQWEKQRLHCRLRAYAAALSSMIIK